MIDYSYREFSVLAVDSHRDLQQSALIFGMCHRGSAHGDIEEERLVTARGPLAYHLLDLYLCLGYLLS
jgi:hypothetical protein